MKNKLIGFSLFILVFIVAIYASNYSNEKTNKRVHQHLEDSKRVDNCNHQGEEFCTHLPLVVIDTQEKEVPGEVYFEGEERKYTLTEDGEKMLLSSMKVIDNGERNNHLQDKPAIEESILIRLRGNSSRHFDKKSYLIRFVEEEKYKNLSVMGMDPHYEWAIYGPYLDKSLIRNYMWYNIAGEIMDYAPNVRFCEVILNDEYIGLYVMVETITSGSNARLRLTEPNENTNKTGYILRLDRGSEEVLKNITTFTNYSLRNVRNFNIEYPRLGSLNEDVITSIEMEFSDFEKALYSYDYNSRRNGYRKYIDVNSFIDYFIINEFTTNYDALSYSTYIYKDIGGKYKLAVWDFNSSFNNYQDDVLDPKVFMLQNKVWYFMLIKDEYFCDRLIKRYRELRKGVLSDEYLNNYIDSVIDYLGEAIDRNFEVWGYSFEYDLVNEVERNPKNYEEAVLFIKEYMAIRSSWMDEHIEVLRQYSHESKIKKFNH